jgi:hypothetical protein
VTFIFLGMQSILFRKSFQNPVDASSLGNWSPTSFLLEFEWIYLFVTWRVPMPKIGSPTKNWIFGCNTCETRNQPDSRAPKMKIFLTFFIKLMTLLFTKIIHIKIRFSSKHHLNIIIIAPIPGSSYSHKKLRKFIIIS